MSRLSFRDFTFLDKSSHVEARFMRIFSFDISKEKLERISSYRVEGGDLVFDESEERAMHKLSLLLDEGLRHLHNRLNKKPALYIHQNSGIPLIGSGVFGLIDRGSNLIEVKPITGCNLDCVYCSIDNQRRVRDYVVQAEYLIQEFARMANYKNDDDLEAHIGTHGEPMLYANLEELVSGLASIPQVKRISMDTNGTMLTPDSVHRLARAGLTRFNVSVNALQQSIAQQLAGRPYRLDPIMRAIQEVPHVAELSIAPVLIPGYNEESMEELIRFSQTLEGKYPVRVCIQNFLFYRGGRKPTTPWPMETFYNYLKELENKHGTQLVLSAEDFGIHKAAALPKPFRTGDVVKARYVADGRMKRERLAVARGRVITFYDEPPSRNVSLRITRSKHNIFFGKLT